MFDQELHYAQMSILHTLRHKHDARYSELRQPTHMESDIFKFHLRKLVKFGYVTKLESGAYQLTALGKEFANNLSKTERKIQKQPKLSVVILMERTTGSGRTEYLFHNRRRNPYYDFWSLPSGPVQWGESFEDTAHRELKKQTGLEAGMTVRAFMRKRDFDMNENKLLEDKFFAIIEAVSVSGEINNSWPGGKNEWLTVEELKLKQKYFASTLEQIELVKNRQVYKATVAGYKPCDY